MIRLWRVSKDRKTCSDGGAALFEGVNPDDLIVRAVARFRCISWASLSQQRGIIVSSETLDGQQALDWLYNLSTTCHIGECDAFFSHSWHDTPDLKWEALSDWCSEFERDHERSPTLWFDKTCVDQSNIQADLECLPIFLAACDILLVICGATYNERLWCCVELFVHVQMTEETETGAPVILTIGVDAAEHQRIQAAWRTFDAARCKCYDEADKARIFEVITHYPGGVTKFNQHIQAVATNLFGKARRSTMVSALRPLSSCITARLGPGSMVVSSSSSAWSIDPAQNDTRASLASFSRLSPVPEPTTIPGCAIAD